MAFDAPPSPDRPPDRGVVGQVVLNGQYQIHSSEPFAALNAKGVEAFRATDPRFPAESYVALTCTGELLPRIEAMSSLRGVSKSGMLTLVAFGPVDWPDGRQRLAALYTAPAGGRFPLSGPLGTFQIVEGLLRPAAAALHEIHGRGAVHRNIRPDNLFQREGSSTAFALGPCVATPPGYEQPAIYEPLECAAADPAGRGTGTPKHDIFALGMTAVAMLLGRQPGSEYDRDALMIRRLENGSLKAVIERSSIPPELADALISMTTDDETDRWTVNDLQKWLNGGRPDLARQYELPKALAPYDIGGHQVRSARSLGYMLSRRPAEAPTHLRSDAMSMWLRDYAPERTAQAMLDHAMTERPADTEGGDYDAIQVAHAVLALDPEGPVRYRGVAVDPHGVGPLMVDALGDVERRAAITGIIRYGLPQRALDRRLSERRTSGRRANRQAINFERLRRWIVSPVPWEGYERCLYDINLNLPCLSPMTGGRWVSSVADLVMALDRAALSGAVKEPSFDNHLAAFIGARFDTPGDALLSLMQPAQADDDATLGAIRMFAELQQSYGSPPLRGIAQWCGNLASRIAERIHHRPSRQKVLATIEQAIPTGSVATILKAIDRPGLKQRDEQGFAACKTEYARIAQEIRVIERNAEARRSGAQHRGRDNAALIASTGSIVVAFLTLMLDSGR